MRDALCSNLEPGHAPPLSIKVVAAFLTGSISICFANPCDVVKVRMQSSFLKGADRSKWPSCSQVYHKIYSQEGFKGYYTGIKPNIMRNAMCNVGEMASYDQYKEMLLKYTPLKDNILCHFVSATLAGTTATIVSSPFDVVKTRVMSNPGAYGSLLGAFVAIARHEGFGGFYKGFIPSCTRISIWTITMFITLEQLKRVLGTAQAHH